MRQCFAVILLCLLFLDSMSSAAQESTPPRKVVAFVEDNLLHTSSLTDVGGDGLTRLAEIFQQFGAVSRSINLDQAIPSDVAVVVLVRPTAALHPPDINWLWDYLSRGGHVLLAFDPNDINKINSDRLNSGLNKLLWADYGVRMNDDVLVEDWFGPQPFQSVVTTLSAILPENIVHHPVIAPLLRFDVPVYVWAARSIQVDALSQTARAYPLLFTETAFGETNRNALRAQDPEPIQMNLGQDNQGRLLVAGLTENTKNGARIALLGDSEIVQNIFGLTRLSTADTRPRYPGNYVLVQRLAAWLLGLPEEEWRPLPTGFTWITLDGNADDWDASLLAVSNKELSQSGIQRVRAFYNDQYLYVLIETASTPSDSVRFTITMQDAAGVRNFALDGNEAALLDDKGNKTLLPDAAVGIGSIVEARLPRRALSGLDSIMSICLNEGDASGNHNCLDQSFRPPLVNDIDPAPVRPVMGPEAFLLNEGNLRTGPGTSAPFLTTLPGRTLLKIIGRNEAGDWVKGYDGRWQGWVAVSLLAFNGNIESLPVLP